MDNFVGVTASNGARVGDVTAAREVLRRYDLHMEDSEIAIDKSGVIHFNGYDWPRVGLAHDEDDDNDGHLEGLMMDMAPHLLGPWVVQAVGFVKCQFPLSACEWRVSPKGGKIEVRNFQFDT